MTPHLLFTACDAGSANFFVPILRQLLLPFTVFAQDKAAIIFQKAEIQFELVSPSSWLTLLSQGESLLEKGVYSYIISGTSWGATVDKAITLAAKKKIPTIAIVEHWNLYRERFSEIEQGNIKKLDVFLPDEIWVVDKSARDQAQESGLPSELLVPVGHPFLEYKYIQLCAHGVSTPNKKIVFISENIREHFIEGSDLGRSYDEYSALEWLLDTVDFSKYELLIKLHPQEDANKYEQYLKGKKAVSVRSVKNTDTVSLICDSHKIVGMSSMFLLEASLVRSDVLSIMPGSSSQDFIGNSVGATQFVETKTVLAKRLKDPPVGVGQSEFGKRFLGSTKNVLSLIKKLKHRT